jgi:uncharacterized protein
MMLAALLSALLVVAPASGVAERPMAVPAPGGVTLAATLTVPPGPGPHPAAVLVSGFGPASRDGSFGRPGGPYADLARDLARAGVATLRYDKRGTGGSGGPALSWLDARALTRDASAAVRALAALPGLRRVALIGHSQGGDLALAAAPGSRAARVVTLAAPGRPLGDLPRVSGGARALLERLAGPRAARATLASNPAALAGRVRVPLLLVHGSRDGMVPAADMALLAAARRAAGRPARTLTVRGADHFLQVDGRVPAGAVRRIAAFVS